MAALTPIEGPARNNHATITQQSRNNASAVTSYPPLEFILHHSAFLPALAYDATRENQDFAEEIFKGAAAILGKGKSRAYTRSKERLPHGEKEAERLLKEGLLAAGLREGDLGALPANEKRKVAIARAIWRQTTVSQVWIAEKLKMQHAANVSLALHRDKGIRKELPAALGAFVKMQENAH